MYNRTIIQQTKNLCHFEEEKKEIKSRMEQNLKSKYQIRMKIKKKKKKTTEKMENVLIIIFN